MYRGFNLKLALEYDEKLYKIGTDLFTEQRKNVQKKLDKFLLPNMSLNGSDIQKNWFPEIPADIFLSHSHKDERTALILAGWLYHQFELKTFIDSSVWGYSNELLKIIDNEYCKNSSGETYSYEKRNYSTSHVHLMLSTALNKMIDNCECIFFLNTPNSVSSNVDKEMTASPWIYTEMAMIQTIQKKTPKRIELKSRTFSKGENLNENFMIEYEIELSHLKDLDLESLKSLQDKDFISSEAVLDDLYGNHLINNKFYK
jgi:hypothetical protein